MNARLIEAALVLADAAVTIPEMQAATQALREALNAPEDHELPCNCAMACGFAAWMMGRCPQHHRGN